MMSRPENNSDLPPIAFFGSEKLLLNILAVLNTILGLSAIALAIGATYSTLSTNHHFWPDFLIQYTAGHMVRFSPNKLYDYQAYLDFYHTLAPVATLGWWDISRRLLLLCCLFLGRISAIPLLI